MDVERGQVLAVAGCLLFVASMAVSAWAAPAIGDAGGATAKTVVGIQGGGVGWHEHGRVTMYENRSVAWQADAAGSYFDVTATDDGTVVAGFKGGKEADCAPYDPPCARTGFQVIDPESTPRVVSEYSFPVRRKSNNEVHDVERIGPGEYVLADMLRERLVAVDDGRVAWQWNASTFYDAPPDPTATDWLHINDVDRIGDGRYLVSVRNANQLVIVERGDGVVEVVNADATDADDDSCRGRWQLQDTDGDGDVRCGDPSVLDHQHNPQWLGDGAVLVADSGNDRIVELRRRNGTWKPAWTLEGVNGVSFRWPRDADRLPGGGTLVTDTFNHRVVEVNGSGAVRWSVRTDQIPYEADRLPHGEMAGGLPRHEDGEVTDPDGGLPGLATGVSLVRAAWPGLPHWFGGLQLLAGLLSLGLVTAGSVAYWRRE